MIVDKSLVALADPQRYEYYLFVLPQSRSTRARMVIVPEHDFDRALEELQQRKASRFAVFKLRPLSKHIYKKYYRYKVVKYEDPARERTTL